MAEVERQLAVADMPWYVCMTKPRQERWVAERLEKQGYDVFFPVLVTWKNQRGAWTRQYDAMFPRYAFVRPGRPEQALSPVRSTPGVTMLVSFGQVLGCIAPGKIDALRLLVQEYAEQQPEQPFEPGQSVVVSSGPLKGLAGLVSNVAANRVTVMLQLLGRDQRVSVSVDQLTWA